MLILYGCIEMTDMVKDLLDDSLPVVMNFVKSVVQVNLPDFILELLTDSVMRALLTNSRIAHM